MTSILDNDLYKFTMQQAVLYFYSWEEAEYELKIRTPVDFKPNFFTRFLSKVEELGKIRLTAEEREYLESLGYFSESYLDYLSDYRFNPAELTIVASDSYFSLKIKGPWRSTILWEVPLMAIISELFFQDSEHYGKIRRTFKNISKLVRLWTAGVPFADMGTRRRFSYEIHDEFVKMARYCPTFSGTSNVHLAFKYGVKPIGTYAHEWVMYKAILKGIQFANSEAIYKWLFLYKDRDKYYPELLIGLTDTYTTDLFLESDYPIDSLKGFRQDSGNPLEIGEKIIKYYLERNIYPLNKKLVFSDSLSTSKAIKLYKAFKRRIRVMVGIGTHFTNDVGVKPLNMVIKLTRATKDGEWHDAVKLSDSPGKESGNPVAIAKYKRKLEGLMRLC